MIGLVAQIWGALSNSQQAIAVACIVLVVTAVGIFVYGQTRRELMIIPKVIYRMSKCANELTTTMTMISDSKELTQFTGLIGIVGHLFEKINDYETLWQEPPH